MGYYEKNRTGVIGCAIGTVVVELTAKGLPINRDNILYELECMKRSSNDLHFRAILQDAAKLLRTPRPD